jgi:signal transduction histidine kinase
MTSRNAIMDKVVRALRDRPLVPWVVLALGIVASFLLSAVIREAVDRVAQLRFERQAGDANGIIQGRLQFYAEIMYGLSALFSSQGTVTRLQFHRFIESLQLRSRYPGFDAVNYAVYVPGKDKERFENEVRRDTSMEPGGYPNFSVYPPGRRSEYFVIVYMEPMKGYEFAFGRDLGANPGILDPEALASTMRAGRDSGKLIASGLPIRVKDGARDQTYLAMRLAVYRNGMPVDTVERRRAAYLGSVGAGFNVETLMKGVLSDEVMQYMRFRLYDAGFADSPKRAPVKRPLFDSRQLVLGSAPPIDEDPDSSFMHVLPVEMAGRIWEVQFTAPKEAVIGRLEKQFSALVFAGGMVSSLLLFGVLYSLASSRSRAVGIANDITKDLRESQEQLQALSRRLVEVQELERRRLSSELHDRVGQNLTALSINLDILKTRVAAAADEEVASRLDDSQHLLGATADTIDNVMSELRPPMLDDHGLHAALSWHGREFSRRTGIGVAVRGDEAGERPAPEIEITLFRIAQEALNNVAKHAQAGRVAINLEFRAAECIMSVSDDGRGMATERSGMKRQGIGMVTMRERAQAVGGTFEVRSVPGDGTQIAVRIPR